MMRVLGYPPEFDRARLAHLAPRQDLVGPISDFGQTALPLYASSEFL